VKHAGVLAVDDQQLLNDAIVWGPSQAGHNRGACLSKVTSRGQARKLHAVQSRNKPEVVAEILQSVRVGQDVEQVEIHVKQFRHATTTHAALRSGS
jgi:hypothetical protein